jgi:hypothetical protein
MNLSVQCLFFVSERGYPEWTALFSFRNRLLYSLWKFKLIGLNTSL